MWMTTLYTWFNEGICGTAYRGRLILWLRCGRQRILYMQPLAVEICLNMSLLKNRKLDRKVTLSWILRSWVLIMGDA
jgi:hypothetical protein